MKVWILVLAAVLCTAIHESTYATSLDGTGGDMPGRPGVTDDSCHALPGQPPIKVDVRAQTNGNMRVTVTDIDGNTGFTTWGTPDPDGGVANSPQFHVNGTWYRVKNGRMQERDEQGNWKNMKKRRCPVDEVDFYLTGGGNIPGNYKFSGGESIGSLPQK